MKLTLKNPNQAFREHCALYGMPVSGFTPATEDFDAEVVINDRLSIQVCSPEFFSVGLWNDAHDELTSYDVRGLANAVARASKIYREAGFQVLPGALL